MARPVMPLSARYTPYFSLAAPRGRKSASSEYLIPIFSAYALCDHTLSTLTPSTSASSVSNAFISLTKQACSLVHVGLQSSGYHTSTTFFFPVKSESFTSFFSWFNSVKSGAACPTAILILFPPVSLTSHSASYRILGSRTKLQFLPFGWPPSPLSLRNRRSAALISFRPLIPGGTLCSGDRNGRSSRWPRSHHAPARTGPFVLFSRRQIPRAGCPFRLRFDQGGNGTPLLRLRRGLSHQPLLPIF